MSVLDGSAVNLGNWQDGPWNRWSFQHVDEVLSTTVIAAQPSAARDLERRTCPEVDAVQLPGEDGAMVPLEERLADSFTDGVAVLHDGRLVYERYFNGMGGDSLHLSMSITKSITGLLVGALVDRGLFEPRRPITDYLPELAHSGFASAAVQDLLNMTASTAYWDEGPAVELVKLDIASGFRPPDAEQEAVGVLEFGSAVGPDARPHGEAFRYASLNTDLVALALERAADARFAELLSELLWVPLGAASAANIAVDPVGAAIASGGLNATVLDHARVGQLVLEDGLVEGRRVVPESWLAVSQRIDGIPAATGTDLPATYSNFWWRVAERTCGLGIHGQILAIDRDARAVIVILSSWPTPEDDRLRRIQWDAIDAIAAALPR